mmetsp:Transcript_3771/g.4561  ORF Transcript_3771/g.4561 Transcript_3771/m.4561 type:complete len:81 (-) Transcript_3771:6-248(-)
MRLRVFCKKDFHSLLTRALSADKSENQQLAAASQATFPECEKGSTKVFAQFFSRLIGMKLENVSQLPSHNMDNIHIFFLY